METACGYLSEDHVLWVSSDDPKWKGRLLKLAEEYPDDVTIVRRPEDNDGCIYLKCPSTWLRIAPPKKVNLSDEQRAAFGERMKKIRKEKSESDKEAQ